MTDKRFKIFLDFDGTITKNDVGEEIFRKNLPEEIVNKIVEDLVSDKISSRECWERLCESALIKDKTEFDDVILTQKIDPTCARNWRRACRRLASILARTRRLDRLAWVFCGIGLAWPVLAAIAVIGSSWWHGPVAWVMPIHGVTLAGLGAGVALGYLGSCLLRFIKSMATAAELQRLYLSHGEHPGVTPRSGLTWQAAGG